MILLFDFPSTSDLGLCCSAEGFSLGLGSIPKDSGFRLEPNPDRRYSEVRQLFGRCL